MTPWGHVVVVVAVLVLVLLVVDVVVRQPRLQHSLHWLIVSLTLVKAAP